MPLMVALPLAGVVNAGAVVPPPLAAMLNVIVAVAEPALFVAVKVTTALLAALGVPEMTPVLAVKFRPAGSVPLLIASVGAGEPLAASV